MNILLIHNFYQQPGGEDQVLRAEARLLEEQGHRVVRSTIHNDQIEQVTPSRLAGRILWNPGVYRDLRRVIRRERPDVVHFHNTFPLLSPSAYYAAKSLNRPVVQTLHNYRLLCVNALLFREKQVCELCVKKSLPWPAIRYGCYRNSRMASGGVAAMLTVHRLIRSWRRKVDLFIVLTEFARKKFEEGGFPPDKLVVKPNLVHPDPGVGEGRDLSMIFVGRLSPEKGVETLIEAWKQVRGGINLKIVGDGPLAPLVVRAAADCPGIEYVGPCSREQVWRLMKQARFLIFPSLCFEGFPLTIAEAFAVGLPVIASDLGSAASLITPQENGFLFRPGDASELAATVNRVASEQEKWGRLHLNSRRMFEAHYSSEKNYAQLMGIYARAIKLNAHGETMRLKNDRFGMHDFTE